MPPYLQVPGELQRCPSGLKKVALPLAKPRRGGDPAQTCVPQRQLHAQFVPLLNIQAQESKASADHVAELSNFCVTWRINFPDFSTSQALRVCAAQCC